MRNLGLQIVTPVVVLWLSVAPVLAQDDSAPQQTVSDIQSTGSVCFSRPAGGASDEQPPFVIEVEADDAKQLAAERGLAVVPCDRVASTGVGAQDDICSVAATADASVNALYRHVFLMSAMELCRSAKRIAPSIADGQ